MGTMVEWIGWRGEKQQGRGGGEKRATESQRIERLQGSAGQVLLDRNLFTRCLSGLELPPRIKLTRNQLGYGFLGIQQSVHFSSSLSLSLHLPLRVLSLSSFFPETLSRNFTLSIRIFHQKLIPIISSFSLLFFFCSFILRLHFELLRASCSFPSPFFRKSRAKVMSIPSCRRVNVWNKTHEISKSSSGQ